MDEFQGKMDSCWTFEIIIFLNRIISFLHMAWKNDIILSNCFYKFIIKHKMRCFIIRCIEIFPIYFIISCIRLFLIQNIMFLNGFFDQVYVQPCAHFGFIHISNGNIKKYSLFRCKNCWLFYCKFFC